MGLWLFCAVLGAAACRDRPTPERSPAQVQHASAAREAPRRHRRPAPAPTSPKAPSDSGAVFRRAFATPDGLPKTPDSFRRAKQKATEIYADHLTTFYCSCPFSPDKSVSWQTCGFEPRANPRRASRIEWEHIVPAHAFGAHRDCWHDKLCTRGRSGKTYGGRQCCGRIDAQFRRMEADLQNLVPAIGEVNGDRSNFRFDDVAGEPRDYGACDFEIDWNLRVAEPSPTLRGDIARAYLYMYHAYPGGLRLDAEQLTRFEQWHRADPPTPWEKTRNRRIAAIQRGGNPLVE